MKLNNIISFLFIFTLMTPILKAQEVVNPDKAYMTTDSNIYSENSASETDQFQEWYHYSDSDQSIYNTKKLSPKFDSAYWKKIAGDMNFEEDTLINSDMKKTTEKKNSFKGFNAGDFKYIFISLALLMLGIVIFYLIKNTNLNNKKVNSELLVNFDELDEQTLKDTALSEPLKSAIINHDFKTAYRLRYLQVLQKLIAKNLISFKKEKTNYDYLLQLSGKNIYEPFRMLTLNFDGIWYGELSIDEAAYTALQQYFNNFDKNLMNA